MADKLYLDGLLIGEIEYGGGDFPTFYGQFKSIITPTDELSGHILKYIDFSKRQDAYYSDPMNSDDRLEIDLTNEELNYQDLCDTVLWKIVEKNGDITNILIPTFDSQDNIYWRLR